MHVHVNAATSIDGKLSTRERAQIRLSGSEDWDRVQRLRAASDAVAVGVGTVTGDDPSLTADRVDDPAGQPTRVVVDSSGRTPLDAAILDDAAPVVLLASEALSAGRRAAYEEHDATVIQRGEERVAIGPALDALAERGIDRLLVEGGGELIFSLIDADRVDRLSVFIGPVAIGGHDAPTLADGRGFVTEFPAFVLADAERIDDGLLVHWERDR